jgi:DNA helicase MCM9
MEQQTLSVAKAGIVCKLNCRASIVAVMNPKDCVYDFTASLTRNTGLGTPLLSRFDVIFTLLDSTDVERDNCVTTYLLNRAILGGEQDNSSVDEQPLERLWTMEKLRAYISLVREKFRPSMSDDAARLLELHYEKCRSCHSTTIPVTVRFLESLIRLSQAHARLMFRNTVTLDDAVAVICVVECTAFGKESLSGKMGNLDDELYRDPMTVDFSLEPDSDFQRAKSILVHRYNMADTLRTALG